MKLTMPWNNNKRANSGWTAPIDEVKQQIGQQVDHLVQVAAQVGRDVAQQATQVTTDAGSQAAGAARDLSGQALKVTQGAGAQAASVARDIPRVAREVPSGAGSLMQQVMDGAAQLGREVRAIRITRQPAPGTRGPDVMPGVALLAGVGGGLALMYFFDPGEGRRRRALLHDQFHKWTRIGRQTAVGKAHDVRNRTVGLAHEARKVVASRSGMDRDMEKIASGASSHTNGTNGYGSTLESGEHAEQKSDQPQPTEVG